MSPISGEKVLFTTDQAFTIPRDNRPANNSTFEEQESDRNTNLDFEADQSNTVSSKFVCTIG